ncbi:MAG TPA: GMC family oxidoreductase [Labilithrix sp.]
MSTPRTLGNQALTTFDVCIIGSGAAGGAVAHMLTKAGKNVLVLEAGPCWYEKLDDPNNQPVPHHSNDELKAYIRNFLGPDNFVEPRSFRTQDSTSDRDSVGDVNPLPKHVGGGGVHADLKMPRFNVDDFHFGTLLAGMYDGTSFADWPVDYDMLEPFYAYMEKTVGIQGQKGSDPFASPISADYPMPPGAKPYLVTKMEGGAQKQGITIFPYPSAINSRPYDGRPACVDCGMCSGYGCPSNAKSSCAVTLLRKALLTGKCQLQAETRVVKIVANGRTVDHLECLGPDGKPVQFRADQYVLAASPIEDARLLLLSGNLGNSSDMVGRNLMFHLQTIGIGIFEERIHSYRGRAVSHGFSDFRGKAKDPMHLLGGIVEVGGAQGALQESTFYTRILGTPPFQYDGLKFKHLMQQSPARERLVALTMQAEDAPQLGNRVDLDPAVKDLDGLPVPRITYTNHKFELDARDFYSPKLLDLLGAAGARWTFIAPKDDISTSAHIMGTLRFGNDPKSSVCGPDGKLHDFDNLWAADGSLFPTSSGYNPTHTIMTLATWVGASIAYPGSPQKGIG